MLRNYFKIALRQIQNNKGYSLINIFGLAVGMACFLFIFLYVQDELSFDRYNTLLERIYRVTTQLQAQGQPEQETALTPIPLAAAILKDSPGAEQAVRFRRLSLYIKRENKHFYEENFMFADAAVFKVFSFPLTKGDPQTALVEPFSVVLTPATAKKYFGDVDPLGETLIVEDTLQFKVTGVLGAIPENSHITFDFLASFETMRSMNRWPQYPWWTINFYTYILLSEHSSPKVVADQIQDLAARYAGDLGSGMSQKYRLQPLADIYLRSNLVGEIGPTRDILYIYAFSAIGVLVLIIACINFINLSTARSINRAREVGLRKTLGAYRWQLTRQFLGESLVVAILSVLLTIALMELFRPLVSDITGKVLGLNLLHDRNLDLALFGVTLFVGLIAGSYPALVLSNFQTADAVRGALSSGLSGSWLRRGLVVFQFAVSLGLMVGTTIVFRQLMYMKGHSLGFNKRQIIVFPARGILDFSQHYEAAKREFSAVPRVSGASASSAVPGRGMAKIVFVPEGAEKNETQAILSLITDFDFLDTYGLELVAGRGFSEAFSTDGNEAFILNETAVSSLGWGTPEAAIGKRISWGWPPKQGRVIGVVKDFHYASLQQRIEPVLMHIQPSWFNYISLKVNTADMQRTLVSLEEAWRKIVPDKPFNYFFLDQDYDRQYSSEQRLGVIAVNFSALAIVIACLGLFGLAAYMTQQRTKEIGVRKLLGASVAGILVLLSKDFVKLVLLAFVIAAPLVYLIMDRWLQNFPYRTSLDPFLFLIAGLGAVLIALLTVCYQSIKSASANPIDCLRCE